MDKYIKYEDIQECRFFQDERGEWILHADIMKLPAADVVPVVRCGECKHSAIDFENTRYCKLVTYYNHVPDDWFCADGARMDGDGDVPNV